MRRAGMALPIAASTSRGAAPAETSPRRLDGEAVRDIGEAGVGRLRVQVAQHDERRGTDAHEERHREGRERDGDPGRERACHRAAQLDDS